MVVEFEEEKMFEKGFNRASNSQSSGGLTNWMIKKGIAKDESGAKTIMVIITVLCFALAIFLMFK